MADKKISQLTAAAALTGTETLPIVQAGSTVKVSTQNVANLALPYTSYVALIDYAGTNPPTVTVFQNNTGKTFNWIEDFIYSGVSVTVSSLDYTKCYMQASNNNVTGVYNQLTVANSSGSTIFAISNSPASNFTTFVEIRIYP